MWKGRNALKIGKFETFLLDFLTKIKVFREFNKRIAM